MRHNDLKLDLKVKYYLILLMFYLSLIEKSTYGSHVFFVNCRCNLATIWRTAPSSVTLVCHVFSLFFTHVYGVEDLAAAVTLMHSNNKDLFTSNKHFVRYKGASLLTIRNTNGRADDTFPHVSVTCSP